MNADMHNRRQVIKLLKEHAQFLRVLQEMEEIKFKFICQVSDGKFQFVESSMLLQEMIITGTKWADHLKRLRRILDNRINKLGEQTDES